MERGSTQHGARLDDELADETHQLVRGTSGSAHGHADLDPEAPEATEVDVTVGPAPGAAPIQHDAVIERSELARWLRPSAFPATPARLRAIARDEGAPDEVVGALDRLRAGARYETFGDVWAAVGGVSEPPRDREHEAPGPTEAPIVDDEAPAVAGPLVTAFQIATFPVRLTVVVVREVYRVGRRIAGVD